MKVEQEPYEIVRSKNAELIMSVKLKNREMSKSRLELEKRLEETKKKLQSVIRIPLAYVYVLFSGYLSLDNVCFYFRSGTNQ